MRKKLSIFLVMLAVSLVAASSASGQATILIDNGDAPGVGFNDATPVAPVGGNNGTTLGQQRLNAFQFAANIWGATLTSGPTITVRAHWAGQLFVAPRRTTQPVLGHAEIRPAIGAVPAVTIAVP